MSYDTYIYWACVVRRPSEALISASWLIDFKNVSTMNQNEMSKKGCRSGFKKVSTIKTKCPKKGANLALKKSALWMKMKTKCPKKGANLTLKKVSTIKNEMSKIWSNSSFKKVSTITDINFSRTHFARIKTKCPKKGANLDFKKSGS